MSRSYRWRRTYLVGFLTLIAVIAGWVFVAGNIKVPTSITALFRFVESPVARPN